MTAPGKTVTTTAVRSAACQGVRVVKLKAYTGRSLEELAPQIREELGEGAVILSASART